MITKFRITVILTSLIAGYLVTQIMNTMSKPPSNIGHFDGKLVPCPDKPNSVLTQASDATHAIAPLTFDGQAAAAWQRLREVVGKLPRTKIISEDEQYLHCEFRTRWMRYVDDVEFLLDADNGKIDFRSASRVGYSDMGANRKRMEEIRRLFAAAAE